MVNIDVLEKLFKEQLKRLRTDYIDFYLMHMMSDIKVWERLKGIGIEKWIEEKKASGEIRNIGFSFHGNSEKFCEIVDAYPIVLDANAEFKVLFPLSLEENKIEIQQELQEVSESLLWLFLIISLKAHSHQAEYQRRVLK